MQCHLLKFSLLSNSTFLVHKSPRACMLPIDAICQPHIRTIDVHHHYFTPDLKKDIINPQLAWQSPPENHPWTPEKSLDAMNGMQIDFAVLSLPFVSCGEVSDENRALARSRNEFASRVCSAHPTRFGFFATLPFANDVEGCLEEIRYALDVLGANGISLSSSYGEGTNTRYIGDDFYHVIWTELDRRCVAVFLHGTQIPSTRPHPHPFLGVPIVEAPHETFKAASQLVVSGHRRKFPRVKVILAHLGGSTPILAPRVAALSRYMGCTLTQDEILEDFKAFYYDTALSANDANLTAMQVFSHSNHLIFGTDFPAVQKETATWFNSNLRQFYDGQEAKLRDVMCRNAQRLLSRMV